MNQSLNSHPPKSYEIGKETRTSLVTNLVRLCITKVQYSDDERAIPREQILNICKCKTHLIAFCLVVSVFFRSFVRLYFFRQKDDS